MKLTELLINQNIIVQLIWGEKKIEFYSDVIECNETAVYVTPYIHNGSVLDLNVIPGKGVVCNLFTDEPNTKQRISWKNVELTTVTRNNEKQYCLKSYGFNKVASLDDRRHHERIHLDITGTVFDEAAEGGVDVVIHDISDIGISFYSSSDYVPKSQPILVTFTDAIDEKSFDIKVECTITRTMQTANGPLMGCRVIGDNRDYHIYGLLKRLKEKNHNKDRSIENSDNNLDVDKGEDDKG